MTHNQFLGKVQKLQKEATNHKKYTIEIYVSCKFIRASIYVHNEDCSLRDSCHVKIFSSTSNKDIENEYKKMIEFTNSIDSVDDSMTKMYKQFKDLKQKHPDALLLFRCGDLYEAYEEDAQEAAKILDITLTMTSKYKNEDGKSFAIAAFPHFYLDTYLPKLIRAGKRIAICDQIDAPKR